MSLMTWLIISAVLILVELFTMGLTSIWFALGSFAAAITSCITDNLWIQLLVFMLVSVVLWIFTRPIALKHLHLGKEKTNVESLVGQRAVVTATIDNLNNSGKADLNGQEWTARSVDGTIIEAGTTVTVQDISGVKLMVSPETV